MSNEIFGICDVFLLTFGLLLLRQGLMLIGGRKQKLRDVCVVRRSRDDGEPGADPVVGSRLIGRPFGGPGYFHSRPTAAGAGYDATAAVGTNAADRPEAFREQRDDGSGGAQFTFTLPQGGPAGVRFVNYDTNLKTG